jgi:hypothetical protein
MINDVRTSLYVMIMLFSHTYLYIADLFADKTRMTYD